MSIIIAANVHHRFLTTGQRAAMALEYDRFYAEAAKTEQGQRGVAKPHGESVSVVIDRSQQASVPAFSHQEDPPKPPVAPVEFSTGQELSEQAKPLVANRRQLDGDKSAAVLRGSDSIPWSELVPRSSAPANTQGKFPGVSGSAAVLRGSATTRQITNNHWAGTAGRRNPNLTD